MNALEIQKEKKRGSPISCGGIIWLQILDCFDLEWPGIAIQMEAVSIETYTHPEMDRLDRSATFCKWI